MVSLAAVEALAAELWPKSQSRGDDARSTRARASASCWSRSNMDATRADFQAFAKAKGAAELMIPAEVMIVESVPLLGSGKLDFAAVDQDGARTRPLHSANAARAQWTAGRIKGDGVQAT